MSVAEYALSEYAVAETQVAIQCDLGEALPFRDLDARARDDIFRLLGERACYQQQNGLVKNIRIIVDQNLEEFPGAIETAAGETMYSIGLLKSEIAQPIRGELIKTAAGLYQVEDITADEDYVEWTVTARRLQ